MLLAGYLGRSVILMWVLVMFSGSAPPHRPGVLDVTSPTPAQHPRLHKRICTDRASGVRAEETVEGRSTLEEAPNQGKRTRTRSMKWKTTASG